MSRKGLPPLYYKRTVARDACAAAGSEQSLEPDAAMEITQVLHDYFVPDALDSVYQKLVRFLRHKRAALAMG